MRTTVIICLLLGLLFIMGHVQAQDGFDYNAVIRVDGETLVNEDADIRFQILPGNVQASPVYSELVSITTDEMGWVQHTIGTGTTTDDLFSIDWGSDKFFIEVSVDVGDGFKVLSTSQLMYVPYAFIAQKSSVDEVDDADADAFNESNTTMSLNGTILEIVDAGGSLTVDLTSAGSADNDEDPGNEWNISAAVNNTTLEVTDAGGTLSADLNSLQDGTEDADPLSDNEIQQLVRSNDTVYLVPDGGFYIDEAQELEGGGSVSVSNNVISVGCDYQVGQEHAGGIIIYVDPSGCHGVVCAPMDQAEDVQWNFFPSFNTHGDVKGFFGGKLNTDLAIFYLEHGNYAPFICDDLELNGYDDWYLPAQEELIAMIALHRMGIGGFSNSGYWSSTTSNNGITSTKWEAVIVNPTSGEVSSERKELMYNVRAVRAF